MYELNKLGSGSISWDHGIIAEVGRDPCSEQGQLQQVYQGCVWSDFEYLQRWRHHKLSVQPVPVFNHLHSKNICYLEEFLYFGLCPVPPVLSLGTTGDSLVMFSSLHHLCIWIRPLKPSLLWAEQSQLSQPFLV